MTSDQKVTNRDKKGGKHAKKGCIARQFPVRRHPQKIAGGYCAWGCFYVSGKFFARAAI
jgi:hypothetical protein